jgi:CO/xanthine dehydrogenase FAD-binding subunit
VVGKRSLMWSDLDYVAASTIEEAVALQAGSSGAAYLLGGTDLLPQMRAGRKAPGRLVDLKRIPLLREIRETESGALLIGAAVPMADVEIHPAVLARYPLLAECVKTIGAWPLRQRATLAGNVCNASPAADTAVALLALDAILNLVSAQGRRSIPVSAFFRGPGQTALQPGELMTDVVLPAASAGFTGSYLRLSRRKGMDLATVGVLVGKCNGTLTLAARWRIALAAVAPTPLRVREAEALLEAKGAAAAREAAELAVAACRPITDLRGSAEYRRDMVGVLVRRGVGMAG